MTPSLNPRTSALSTGGASIASKEEEGVMHARALELRAEFKEAQATGDYSKLGTLVHIDDQPVGVRLHPDRKQDFRCALSLGKEEIDAARPGSGAAVLLRNIEGYKDATLYLNLDATAGGGLTKDGTVISLFKAPPNSPKESPRHRMPDLMEVIIRDGGDHLACLASLQEYYNRTYGFETFAVVPKVPTEHTPGWGEQQNEMFKKDMDKFQVTFGRGESEHKISLPLTVMRLNPELRARILTEGKLATPSMDVTDLDQYPQVLSAHDGYAMAVRLRNEDVKGRNRGYSVARSERSYGEQSKDAVGSTSAALSP